MLAEPPIFQLPNCSQPRQFRLLWHQTLGELLRYPELPRRCLNFDMYPVTTPRINSQRTLGSVVSTRHSNYLEDAVITEIWLADNLSMYAGFFYELMRFFQNGLDAGEYLVWYPKDKTYRAFCIDPVALYAGDKENQSLNPVHKQRERNYRWLRDEVRFEFRVLRVFDMPDAIAYLDGV